MKLKLIGILTSLATAGLIQAATVTGVTFNFAGAPDITGGVLFNGVAATPGQVIANVGYFNSGFDVTTAVGADDFGGLITNFNIVASANVGSTAGTYGADFPGLFETPQGSLAATLGSPAIGQTLYTFFGAGAILSASGPLGLINSGQVVAVDGFPPTTYVLSHTPTSANVLIGEFVASSQFSASTLGVAAPVSRPAINLVPEPSAALLGALGALGLLRRRRN